MDLDLADLREMHPRLPEDLALVMIARGSITFRLTERLEEVSRSEDVDEQWAGVVGFQQPVAALRSTKAVEP
ncbi:MAG: hypothetical protein ACJ76J_29425 [Thermoanaerobaculia bacterium]